MSIIEKYPVKNDVWTYSPEGDVFVTKDSQLQLNRNDPWGRPLSQLSVHHEGDSNKIYWCGLTTIDAIVVRLKVFSD